MSSELHCMQFVELITDYEERALPAEVRAEFEAHRGYCDGCQELLRQLKLTRKALAPRETSGPVPEKLLSEYRKVLEDRNR